VAPAPLALVGHCVATFGCGGAGRRASRMAGLPWRRGGRRPASWVAVPLAASLVVVLLELESGAACLGALAIGGVSGAPVAAPARGLAIGAVRGHAGGAADARAAAKRDLLDAVAHFKEVQARTGGEPSIDFGVKGGELDKRDRAPRNLAADGAFRRLSEELGDAADAVLERADQLAAHCPGEQPLRAFGTAEGATACLLHGAWRLLFTTAADATFSKNSSRGAAKVCNVVDAAAGTVTNCIDFVVPATGKRPPVESLRVRLTAQAVSDRRLNLAFRFVRARVTKFFGLPLGGRRLTITLPVPGPLLSRVISFFTRKAPPQPYFDLLYLDDELRVHRTGQGNLFVQERSDVPEFL